MIHRADCRPGVTDVSQVSQDLVERRHGIDRVVLKHVREDPLGEDRVVPHDAGHRDDWHAGGEEQADRRVSAVVRPHPAQASFGCETLEVSAVRARMNGLTDLVHR